MVFDRVLSIPRFYRTQLLLFCCVFTSVGGGGVAQSSEPLNLSGTWRGIATAGDQSFPYRWLISQQGDSVVGTITLSNTQATSSATYTMHGTISGSRLTFEGEEFLTQTPGSSWCIASGNLNYRLSDNEVPILSGEWGAHNVPGGCPAGTRGNILLEKTEP